MHIYLMPNKHYAAITVRRDERKPRTESDFWVMVKRTLQRDYGHDVIKKPMSKDGHMVSEGVYYVRTRKWGRVKKHIQGEYALWDDQYAIRDVAKELREKGVVNVRLEW